MEVGEDVNNEIKWLGFHEGWIHRFLATQPSSSKRQRDCEHGCPRHGAAVQRAPHDPPAGAGPSSAVHRRHIGHWPERAGALRQVRGRPAHLQNRPRQDGRLARRVPGDAARANPAGTYTLLTADASLVSDIDSAVDAVLQKETKVDLLFMSPGFFAFEGRVDTKEGLDPSMSTRYYSPLRAVKHLLPLLNAAPSPRVVSVLAAGEESPLNEADLDLHDLQNWSMWNASRHACTMGTLALERIARDNPRLSIAHCHPGAVATPGLARSKTSGLNPPNPMS